MITFSRSKGPYAFLSNMAKSPISFNNEPFTCAESAWQAQKCADPKERECFFIITGPAAKRLGEVVNTRPDWNDIRYDVLIEVLIAKFEQNETFREALLNTDEEEILFDTTGWHDNTWGRCSCVKCSVVPAQNLLGKALVEARRALREKM